MAVATVRTGKSTEHMSRVFGLCQVRVTTPNRAVLFVCHAMDNNEQAKSLAVDKQYPWPNSARLASGRQGDHADADVGWLHVPSAPEVRGSCAAVFATLHQTGIAQSEQACQPKEI